MAERWIYHITSEEAFRNAVVSGCYEHPTLRSQGFFHCSTAEQVIDVANARFRGNRGLLLLKINATKVRPEIRYENLEGGTTLFPHIYGTLNLDAIMEVLPFMPNDDGIFEQHLLS